jgi:hypothetical protein
MSGFKGLPPGVPATQFSEDFAQSMANSMGVSFFKYGDLYDAYPQKVNALDSLLTRLKLYKEGGEVKGKKILPGNRDYLIDVANFAMIEFLCPSQKVNDEQTTDDAGSPGRTWHALDSSTEQKNRPSRLSEFRD